MMTRIKVRLAVVVIVGLTNSAVVVAGSEPASDPAVRRPHANQPLGAGSIREVEVFKAGEGGYAVYRIPGLVTTARGSLLAYGEARRKLRGDWGAIDAVMRRSTDGGATWSAIRALAETPGQFVKNPVAVKAKLAGADEVPLHNPVMIASAGGAVHLLYTVDYARVFVRRSDDDGQSWTAPREITDALASLRDAYPWLVVAVGPGHGIELRGGPHRGRLVASVWLSTGDGGHGHRPSVVTTLVSDDAGQTWRAGAIAVPHTAAFVNPNETAVVELGNGRVMLNSRSESPVHRRLVTIGPDGLSGWGTPRFEEALPEPICMGSLVGFASPARLGWVAFANPANLMVDGQPGKPGRSRPRLGLTLRLSGDEGRTWPVMRVLDEGWSGYSDLALSADESLVHCLYERGQVGGHAYAPASLTLLSLPVADLGGPPPGPAPNP